MLAWKTAAIRAYLVCVSVSAASFLEPSSKAAGGGARGWVWGGMVPSAGGWVCQQVGGYGLEVGC